MHYSHIRLVDYENISSIEVVRFEAFTAVIMKNVVFLDVVLCGSCVN
jgi:hypothetical protein